MFWRSFLAVLFVSAFLGAAMAEGIEVPLTVTNRTSLERWELASGGVPLPLGAAKETGDFRVFDTGGKAVPAQFTVLNRWPSDESIRWMLVMFPVKLAGNATGQFTLKQDPDTPMPKPQDEIKVTETDDGVAVFTGPLYFSIKKKSFTIVDHMGTCLSGGKQPRLTGDKPFGPGAVIETSKGEVYEMGAAPPSRIAVEDAGPLRATILAEGRHADKKGNTLFDYQVRIYATAGSRAVRVQYVMTRSKGEWPAEQTDIKHVYVKYVPTPGARVTRSVIGPKGEQIAENDSEMILRLESSIKPGGGGERFYEGPAVASVRQSGDRGHMASVRWFWQLRPKSMEVARRGGLTISLIDARAEGAEPVHFYPGMSKTHDMLFHFIGPGPSNDTEHTAAGFQHPFFVRCPPEWYCQKTLSLGRLVSADYKGYLPELQGIRKKIDDSFVDQISWIRKARRRTVDRKRDIDGHTVIHFGDGFHHFFGSDHKKVQWDNCYYSYTHMLAMQYARTGDDLYLDTLREAATFEGDIAIVWHERNPGAPRVNPGAYHIGGFAPWRRFASSTWNFYKPIGMLELYCLTGDRRHKEAGELNARWMLSHNGYCLLSNPRSCGAGMRAAAHGYLATGEKGFLEVGRRTAMHAAGMQRTFGHFGAIKNARWMAPNALEGLCVYHELTGDEVLTKILPDMVRENHRKFGRGPAALNYAYMNLYVAWLAGDTAWRDEVLKALAARKAGCAVKKGEHAVKDFSLGHRGVPLAMWYLSDLAGKPTPWAGKIDLGKVPATKADCPKVDAPKLDGKLDTGEWDKAGELSLVYDPDATRKLAAPTKLKVGHDLKSIYILVQAEESKMGELVTEITEEGGPVYRDDAVELYLSPVPRRYGLKLIINAKGVKATRARGFEKGKYKAPEPGEIAAAAGTWEKGWLLEVAVPLAKLGLRGEPKAGMELGFNCVRFRHPAPREISTWIGAINQVHSIGTLTLR